MTRRLLTAAVVVGLAVSACGDDSGPEAEVTSTSAAAGVDSGAAVSTTTTPASTTTLTPTTVPVPATYTFPLRPSEACDYTDGHHDYPANDIFCPIGTEVVAVTDGVVDFTSPVDRWDPAIDDPSLRGGISVAIVGDDGVRYYGSHLSSLAPGIEAGVRVRTGQRLGLSGDSGNAAGTPPHLHFGISRPTIPADWMTRRGEVNPYPYLQAWERGDHLTPILP